MGSALKNIATLIGATVLAFVILTFGQLTWTFLVIANKNTTGLQIPWSAGVMALVLWLMWKYLGGAWWPRRTASSRQQLLRSRTVPVRVFALALLAGIFSLVALAGYWIVMFDLFPMSPNVLPKTDGYSLLTVAALLIMSSLVSPFTEEAAFRGYFQVTLERRFKAVTAVVISSVYFALVHLSHGFFLPKLSVYFLAGIVFGTIAYMTNSTLPAIPVHILGDFSFFTLVWPYDASRRLITDGGSFAWLWIHVAQAVVFTGLAILVFSKLAQASGQERARGPETGRANVVTLEAAKS